MCRHEEVRSQLRRKFQYRIVIAGYDCQSVSSCNTDETRAFRIQMESVNPPADLLDSLKSQPESAEGLCSTISLEIGKERPHLKGRQYKVMTELMDATAAKIVLSAKRGDSINRIADKIDVSYSWTYNWVERLEEARVIASTDNGIEVVDHEIRQQYAEMMAALYSRDAISQEDAYIIPHFAGMEFAYTEIDAAYVWTHGGYQIARTHDDYPVFIQVHDRDVGRWNAFFHQFDIEVTINERPDADDIDGDIHYVVFPEPDGIDVEWVNGSPVIPLEDTVDQMMENRPAYEPALEIIAREHDIDIDAIHHGAMTAD